MKCTWKEEFVRGWLGVSEKVFDDILLKFGAEFGLGWIGGGVAGKVVMLGLEFFIGVNCCAEYELKKNSRGSSPST